MKINFRILTIYIEIKLNSYKKYMKSIFRIPVIFENHIKIKISFTIQFARYAKSDIFFVFTINRSALLA